MKKELKEDAKAEEETAAAKDDKEAPVPLVNHVDNILRLILSNVEGYINNQRFHNSDGLYAHQNYKSNTFNWAMSEQRFLHCEVDNYKICLDEIMNFWN